MTKPSRLRAWLRALLATPHNPAMVAEHQATVLVRTKVSALVAALVIPFTVFAYFSGGKAIPFGLGLTITLAAELAIALVIGSLQLRYFRAHYHLPFFLLVGVICSGTEALLLELSGGAAGSDFLFPYFLILFGIATLFPSKASWAVASSLMIPVTFIIGELAGQGQIGPGSSSSDLILLCDAAFIAMMGNRVTTRLYFSEAENRHALEAANQQLRELDQAKTDFFANLSHDLKTPLNLIIAPLEAVAQKNATLDARGRRYLELAIKGARRLDAMINDLLELARIEAGVSTLHLARVDLRELVGGLLETSGPYAAGLGLRLDFVPAPGDELVADVDPDKFERVVMNLVSNALKLSEPGKRVWVGLRALGDQIELSIHDQGPGIHPDDLDRIFARFIRGRDEARRRTRGAGIGLSVVREFVSQHRGRVYATSQQGEGSTFTVLVPRRTLGEAEPLRAPAAPVSHVGPPTEVSAKRLLLIEDDDETRVFLAGELSPSLEVISAADGESALRLASERPDVVLVDVMMPGIDGLEVCARLRRHPATAHVPILVYSANADLATRLKAFESGADDFMLKPVELLELRARLDSLLRRSLAPRA